MRDLVLPRMKTRLLRSRLGLVALAVGVGLSTTACFGRSAPGASGCPVVSMSVSAVSIHWEPFGPPNSYTAKLRATVVNGTNANVSNSGFVLVHAVTAPNGPNNTTDWDASAYGSGGGDIAPGQSVVWEGVAVISVIAGSQPPDVVASSWQAKSGSFFWGTGVPFNLGCSNYSGP